MTHLRALALALALVPSAALQMQRVGKRRNTPHNACATVGGRASGSPATLKSTLLGGGGLSLGRYVLVDRQARPAQNPRPALRSAHS